MTSGDDKISGIYQQGKEQGPPAHLDDAVLKAAHEAVGEAIEEVPSVDNLSVVRGPFSGGWRATLSIAAVLVITVILVPLMEQEEPVPAAFDAPNDEVDLLKRQSYKQELEVRENKQLSKEKAKKREMLSAPKVQLERRMQLNGFSAMPEMDSDSGKLTAEESLAPMRSSVSAPASAAAPANVQQQDVRVEVKSEGVGRQKSSLLMDSAEFYDTVEVDGLAPKQWLDEIRLLIEQGEMEAARKAFDAFKLHYPDEEVDPVLLDKIKSSS